MSGSIAEGGVRTRQGLLRERAVKAEQLCDVFGFATRVATAERRLRCSKCGHKGARLVPVPKLD